VSAAASGGARAPAQGGRASAPPMYIAVVTRVLVAHQILDLSVGVNILEFNDVGLSVVDDVSVDSETSTVTLINSVFKDTRRK
jgi:hypothetical protein